MSGATVVVVTAALIVAAVRNRWGRNAYLDGALLVLGVAVVAVALPDHQQGWLRVSQVALGVVTAVVASASLIWRVPRVRA